ncbi:MAG: hypothetical protein RMX65_004850 [Nostoc sp. DedQUE01]
MKNLVIFHNPSIPYEQKERGVVLMVCRRNKRTTTSKMRSPRLAGMSHASHQKPRFQKRSSKRPQRAYVCL